jgi:hypothetical protein
LKPPKWVPYPNPSLLHLLTVTSDLFNLTPDSSCIAYKIKKYRLQEESKIVQVVTLP